MARNAPERVSVTRIRRARGKRGEAVTEDIYQLKHRRRGTTRREITPGKIISWLVLVVFIFISLFPVWWVVRTAFSSSREIFQYYGDPLPVDFTLGNFERVLGLVPQNHAMAEGGIGPTFDFLLALRNSVIASGLIVMGQLFFSSMAAYAFARLSFPLREQLFFAYVVGMMIPAEVTLIPNFVLVHDLGLINTFAGIVAPYLLSSAFAVFFLRQFMLSMPKELEEVALLDGASRVRIYFTIVLPQVQGALITLGVVVFFFAWNNFLWPYLVGRTAATRVMTAALEVFRSQTPGGAPAWTDLMAGAALAAIPSVLVLIVGGRRVVESLQFSGMK